MNADTDRTEDLITGALSLPAGWTIEPATGGLNSRVFFLRQPGKPTETTVRLSTTSKAGRIRREADILTSLDCCECAPSGVRLIDELHLNGRVLLMHDYIPGSTAPLESVSERQLLALGSCLATVHCQSSDVYTVWPKLEPTIGDRAAAYRDRLSAMNRYDTFSSQISADLHDRIERLYSRLASLDFPLDAGWAETTFSLLHGDTSIGNIIWNGNAVTLIDWEYARHGDPAEDLAYVLAEQPLSEKAASLLWEGYVNAGGDPSAIERVTHYAPLVALDSVLWWGDFHLEQGQDPAASQEVSTHLDRAESGLGKL